MVERLTKFLNIVQRIAAIYPTIKINKELWAEGIQDLSDEELKVGLNWIKNTNEPFPSLNRFRWHAKGFIDPLEAFEYACKQQYIHPAIYAARRHISEYSWRHEKIESLLHKFRVIYNRICNEMLAGKESEVFEKKETIYQEPNWQEWITAKIGKEQAEEMGVNFHSCNPALHCRLLVHRINELKSAGIPIDHKKLREEIEEEVKEQF